MTMKIKNITIILFVWLISICSKSVFSEVPNYIDSGWILQTSGGVVRCSVLNAKANCSTAYNTPMNASPIGIGASGNKAWVAYNVATDKSELFFCFQSPEQAHPGCSKVKYINPPIKTIGQITYNWFSTGDGSIYSCVLVQNNKSCRKAVGTPEGSNLTVRELRYESSTDRAWALYNNNYVYACFSPNATNPPVCVKSNYLPTSSTFPTIPSKPSVTQN